MTERTLAIDPERIFWEAPEPNAPVRLRATRCRSCSRCEFPATGRCPACGSDVDPIPLSANAVLGPRSQVLHPPPGALVPVPYLVGVAQFAEGISVLGLLDADELDAAPVGSTVETVALEPVAGLVTYGYRVVEVGHAAGTA